MRKTRIDLEKYLRKRGDEITFQRKKLNQVVDYAYQTFLMPNGKCAGMIMGNIKLAKETDFSLFCLMYSIDAVEDTKVYQEFFTRLEIDGYKVKQFDSGKAEFPLVYPALAVGGRSQWLVTMKCSDLMRLRASQKIRYNENAQRVPKKVVRGEQVTLKIDVNKNHVNEIATLMRKGTYYPDPLQLNFPDDVNVKYFYDEKLKELHIEDADYLDIVDGYHRYLAMCQNYDADSTFDYDVVMEFTEYSKQDVWQCIWQKDQKTKMTATNIRSMNRDRQSNLVVDRVNNMKGECDLAGKIVHGGKEANVDYAALSDIIERFWLFKRKTELSNVEIKEIAEEVKDILNAFTDANPLYFDRFVGFRELIVMFYIVKEKGYSLKEAGNKTQKVLLRSDVKQIPTVIRPKTFQVIDSML